MISLEEFRRINEADLSDLSDEEIEQFHKLDSIFSETVFDRWLDQKTNNEAVKMVKYKYNERKDLRNRICES